MNYEHQFSTLVDLDIQKDKNRKSVCEFFVKRRLLFYFRFKFQICYLYEKRNFLELNGITSDEFFVFNIKTSYLCSERCKLLSEFGVVLTRYANSISSVFITMMNCFEMSKSCSAFFCEHRICIRQ